MGEGGRGGGSARPERRSREVKRAIKGPGKDFGKSRTRQELSLNCHASHTKGIFTRPLRTSLRAADMQRDRQIKA